MCDIVLGKKTTTDFFKKCDPRTVGKCYIRMFRLWLTRPVTLLIMFAMADCCFDFNSCFPKQLLNNYSHVYCREYLLKWVKHSCCPEGSAALSRAVEAEWRGISNNKPAEGPESLDPDEGLQNCGAWGAAPGKRGASQRSGPWNQVAKACMP